MWEKTDSCICRYYIFRLTLAPIHHDQSDLFETQVQQAGNRTGRLWLVQSDGLPALPVCCKMAE